MPRSLILVLAAVLLVVIFALGLWLGSRLGHQGETSIAKPASEPTSGRPTEPAATNLPEATAAGSSACVDIRNAAPLEGKNGCVTGLVLRVYTARSGNTFLDFCQDYRNCPFSSVIFAADKSKFGALESLQGRRVEIRGEVVDYRGHPEIVIHDPQQVRGGR